MIQTRGKWPVTLALASGLLVLGACTSIGRASDARLPGVRTHVVYGEIQSVDSRRGLIRLREQHRRNQTIRYDNRTRVVYGQRQYPVSALQRGDHVRVQVAYDRNRNPWAQRVDVRATSRDRGRAGGPVAGRVVHWDGRVSQVDTRRNYFTLQRSGNSALVVRVPRRLSREDARRFERLRRGHYVRVEVRPVDRNEAELVRFRDAAYGQRRWD